MEEGNTVHSKAVQFLRTMGILDGLSLLILLGVAMPLKYVWDLPLAVTIMGSLHGAIFMLYLASITWAQLRMQWPIVYSIVAVLVAFIPFGNFLFDRYIKRAEARYRPQPFKQIWLLYGAIFFTFLDLFAQLPVMSTFALSLGASTMIAGLVVGMYSFTNMFGNMASGILTDRVGAKRIAIIGLMLTVLSLCAYTVIDSPTTLLVLRACHGFVAGLITPAAFTLVANQTAQQTQGSQSALTGAFVGIAAILGPAYSGIVATRTSVPFVLMTVAIIGAVVVVALIFFQLTVKKKSQTTQQTFSWNTRAIRAFMAAFLLMMSQGALAYLLPIRIELLGYESRLSGTLMSMFGIVAVLLFVLPTRYVFDKWSAKWLMVLGIAFIGISQFFISITTSQVFLYAILALYGVGFALLFPAMNRMLIEGTTEQTRGRAYGYFYAFFSLGTVVGSSGLALLPLSLTGQFYVIAGVLLIASCLLSVTRDRDML